jgi:hypothetical protein
MIAEKKLVNIKKNDGTLVNSKKLKYIKYESTDCSSLHDVYNKWKALCESLEALGKRTTNIPEAISETAVAIIYSYFFINQKTITVNNQKISTSFDIFDPIYGDKFQIKACSTEKDLTTFGPRSVFDRLIFVDFHNNGVRDGNFTVYDVPINLVNNARVSASQTLLTQAGQSRRPRICLKDIIRTNNITGTQYQLTSTDIVLIP